MGGAGKVVGERVVKASSEMCDCVTRIHLVSIVPSCPCFLVVMDLMSLDCWAKRHEDIRVVCIARSSLFMLLFLRCFLISSSSSPTRSAVSQWCMERASQRRQQLKSANPCSEQGRACGRGGVGRNREARGSMRRNGKARGKTACCCSRSTSRMRGGIVWRGGRKGGGIGRLGGEEPDHPKGC
jgi:hypothetical protein